MQNRARRPTPRGTAPEERASAGDPPAKIGIDVAEQAVDRAFSTGKVDRATVTREAQLDAEEAVKMAGIAMESDEAADEATKLALIAQSMGNRERVRDAKERERVARNKAKKDHRSATKSAKKAYDAIKFSDPTKLGFLRVVQLSFFAHVASTLLVLIMTSRDTVVYNSVNIMDWIMVTLETVAIYFLANRYKAARPFVISISAFGIIARMIFDLMNHSFSIIGTILNGGFYIFLIFYFVFSDRVRAVFINDFSLERGRRQDEDFVIERQGWPFIRNLIIYFVVFSIVGHWMEMAMCQLIRLGIVQGEYDPSNTMLWRDWLYPYAMEGAAVCFIALFLYPFFTSLKKKMSNPVSPYVVSFLANMLTCSVIEFFSGLLFNAQLQHWDYTEMPFNIMGQVCLQNALAFGAASSIIAWWVYPAMERAIARVRPATMNIICVITAIIGGILFSLYAINPPGVDNGSQEQVHYEQEDAIADRESILSSLSLLEGFTDIMDGNVDSLKHISESERNSVQMTAASIKDAIVVLRQELEAANALDQQTLDQYRAAMSSADSAVGADSAADVDAATQTAPAEDAPAEDALAEEVPAEEVPATEAPAEEVPADDAPVEGTYPAEGTDPAAGDEMGAEDEVAAAEDTLDAAA